MSTHVATSNPVRSDLHLAQDHPTTTRSNSRLWALSGLGAGLLGVATIVTSSMVEVVYRDEFKGTTDPVAKALGREREVLDLLAAGASNDAIARKLFVSNKTVRNTVSGIYAKLHANGRAEAIVKARDAGFGQG